MKKGMKKLVFMNMGVLMFAGTICYPIFASDTMEEDTDKQVVQEENVNDTEIESNIMIINEGQSRATVGETFQANIINNGVQDLPCVFKILSLPADSMPGNVQVGTGEYQGNAISRETSGTIGIPNEVSYNGETYKVTALGAFSFMECGKITNTGLENNTTVTTIANAFESCRGLLSTGLEKNTTITTIGFRAFNSCISLTNTGLENNRTVVSLADGAFGSCSGLLSTGLENNNTVTTLGMNAFSSCSGLLSTGLENNNTVTTLGMNAFSSCSGLLSTGLEKNTTITSLGEGAFSSCTGLKPIIFEITTLPSMASGVFNWSNVKIYYAPGTTNPEVLDDVGADSVLEIQLTGIQVKTPPTKIEYIEEDIFSPEGLIITNIYNYGTGDDIVYDDTTKNNFSFDKSKLNIEDRSITITYNNKSVFLDIIVKEKKISSLDIKAPPSKISYIEEERFNPMGLILTLNYNNGTSQQVVYSDSTKNNFSFDKTKLKQDDTAVIITYKNISITQVIQVKVKAVMNISIKNKPINVEYHEGEIFKPDGLVLTVNYDNGNSEDIVYNESTQKEFDFDKSVLHLNDKKVLVMFGGKEAEIAIKVEKVSDIVVTPDVNSTEENKVMNNIVDTSDITLLGTYLALAGLALLIIAHVKNRKNI